MSLESMFTSVKASFLQAKSCYHVDNSMLCTTGRAQHYITKTWVKFLSIFIVQKDLNKEETKCKAYRTKFKRAALLGVA